MASPPSALRIDTIGSSEGINLQEFTASRYKIPQSGKRLLP
jgi:hypothetical protein